MNRRVPKSVETDKASSHPARRVNTSSEHPILHLQRTIGNKAVTGLIQKREVEQEEGGSGSQAKDGEFKDLKVHNLDVSGALTVGGKPLSPAAKTPEPQPKSETKGKGFLHKFLFDQERGKLSNRGSGIRG
jgi:hypothetical protein